MAPASSILILRTKRALTTPQPMAKTEVAPTMYGAVLLVKRISEELTPAFHLDK